MSDTSGSVARSQLFIKHTDIVNRVFGSTLVPDFLFLVLGLLGVCLLIKFIQIKSYIRRSSFLNFASIE